MQTMPIVVVGVLLAVLAASIGLEQRQTTASATTLEVTEHGEVVQPTPATISTEPTAEELAAAEQTERNARVTWNGREFTFNEDNGRVLVYRGSRWVPAMQCGRNGCSPRRWR